MRYLLAAIALIPAAALAQPAAAPGPDAGVMGAQVLLDRLGFGPGVIDGKPGSSYTQALKGYQEANGLKATGKLDAPTQAKFDAYRGMPTVITIKLDDQILAGPFVGPIPKDEGDQAKLKTIGYSDVNEKLAERYHTTPATLAALNPDKPKLDAGSEIKVPNVIPAARDYSPDLKPEWRDTLWTLNVGSDQPNAVKIVVDKSDSVLRVIGEGNKLLAQFPATMGSAHDPLPIGSWKIQGVAYNPPFHYNPKLFWDASSKDDKALLQPGPNGPVGVVWMDLNKAHYGIHGTPRPENIGKTESHGCIRLTNWDAARVAMMVKPGTPAIFQN